MFSSGSKIRVFPFRPTPEPGSFVDFIEETETNGFLIDAVKKLYEVPNKPENPIEWLRLYFKYLASEDRSKEMQDQEESLKAELADIEMQLINILEEETHNQEILNVLEHEYKKITMSSGKNHNYDDFRKYLHHPEDYHYRIKPDPTYQASKTDMLLPDEDRDPNSLLEIRHNHPDLLLSAVDLMQNEESTVQDSKTYEDYPTIYFPEQQQHIPMSSSSAEESEETTEDDYDGQASDEEEEESEGMSTSMMMMADSAQAEQTAATTPASGGQQSQGKSMAVGK